MTDPQGTDPLGAAALREAALTAWRASPARLREDANSEEDHARGGYRDRVVVELAQNAADAAAGGGTLLLRLVPGARPLLVAANTGSPLDARGLASLATLRASAKVVDVDEHASSSSSSSSSGSAAAAVPATPVGRFGVGFSAVRAVSDEIAVLTAAGAAHFSLDRAAALLSAEPDLHAVVASRDGALPALRLPFAGPGPVGESALAGADGIVPGQPWDTVVVLALRDAAAVAQVTAQLEAVDDALLLALPGLASVTVEHLGRRREVAGVRDRWLVVSAAGEHAPADLADRPTEEQGRRGWQLSWAVRRDAATAPGVVHAPTPTDEPCTVPALLIGTFPLDPGRRHVVPGAATDALVREAGRLFGRLLQDCRHERASGRPAPDPLDLVPRGWPGAGLDGDLREAALAATRSAPVLSAAGDGRGIAPRDATVLAAPWTCDRAALDVLGAWDTSIVRLDDTHRDLVRLLGLRTVAMADLVELLPANDPAWLRRVYDLVSAVTGEALADLATAPVPLRDGRVVHGARGLVVVEGPVPGPVLDALSGAGMRIVAPEAAHPVLERLGAERLDAAALARHPVVRARVLGADGLHEQSVGRQDDDQQGPEETGRGRQDLDGWDPDEDNAADLLLGLLEASRAAGQAPADPAPWWGEVLLEAEDGELIPARGLTLPGTDAAAWFDQDVLPRVAAHLVERWGDLLGQVGVLRGLAAVRVDDPLVAESLDGWVDYVEEVGVPDPSEDDPVLAVADLDAVRPEAWSSVVRALADPVWVEALRPVRTQDGEPALAYTAWWLRTRDPLGIGGPFALPGAPGTGTMALLGPPPAALAEIVSRATDVGAGPSTPRTSGALALLRAVGGVESAGELDVEGWIALLDGLEPGSAVDLAVAVDVWRSLGRVAVDAVPLDDLARLPALMTPGPDAQVRVVEAEEVAVVDPMWAQLTSCLPAIVVPADAAARVARVLDLDTAADRAHGRVTSGGHPQPTPAVLRDLFDQLPATWVEHDDLRVDDEPVEWWRGGGTLHACTTSGLATAMAALVGRGQRDRILRLLSEPGARAAVLLDRAGEDLDGA